MRGIIDVIPLQDQLMTIQVIYDQFNGEEFDLNKRFELF